MIVVDVVKLARRVAEFRHPDIHISSGVAGGHGGYSITLSSKLVTFEVVVKADGNVIQTSFVGKVSDLGHVQEILSLAQSLVRV